MNVEVSNTAKVVQLQAARPVEKVAEARKGKETAAQAGQLEKKQIQPEELLSQVKELSEDGIYSVRFENDHETGEVIVKVVDRETDEVTRQIPSEELLELTKRLEDLRGNFVDTQS